VALEDPAELTRQKQSTSTLAELIRWYIDTFETISRWQRSKQTHLEFLERHALGKPRSELTNGTRGASTLELMLGRHLVFKAQ
jgi:hypothetical protein